MKNNVLILLLLLTATTVFAQEEKELEVFDADGTWTKEIIQFPIGFAPDIPYEGYEDLRFAAGWAKKDSPEFWTYIFAWHIKGKQILSTQILETNLRMYFDGLMNAVNKDEDFEVPATTVSFAKKESGNKESDFTGKVTVHDSFHTQATITLNILVKNYYCEEKDESIIVFRISPKAFDNEVWNTFQQVKIRRNDCRRF
jgi:hypothetical protein